MPSPTNPTLTTARLILRAPVADDFPAYARLLASPRAKGMGGPYAWRAAGALRDWAARALGLDGLVSYVDPENRRSVAVAERLGATLHPDAPKEDPGDLVYRHRADHAPH